MLVKKGADSRGTAEKVWNYRPHMHVAAENGHFLALKYLVEECGHDINVLDSLGNDLRASLRVYNPRWTELAGCVACDEYAKGKGVEGEIKSRKKKQVRGSNYVIALDDNSEGHLFKDTAEGLGD